MHFDLTGFIRILNNNLTPLESLNKLFNNIGSNGGNLLVPSFSYSYTNNELYSVKDSMCDLGRVADSLRKYNYEKRTTDALFSYLSFGDWTPRDFFLAKDYESFGDNSLIAEVFKSDGYLLSVGSRLHYSTEIHYLERILDVSYRYNKDFTGTILSLENKKSSQTITYFCRDLNFANEHKVTVSFEKLFIDLDREGKIDKYLIKNEFLLEAIKFTEILPFLKDKLKHDIFYLMKPL